MAPVIRPRGPYGPSFGILSVSSMRRFSASCRADATSTKWRPLARLRCRRVSTNSRACRRIPARPRYVCVSCSERPKRTAPSTSRSWPATRKPTRGKAWKCPRRGSLPRPKPQSVLRFRKSRSCSGLRSCWGPVWGRVLALASDYFDRRIKTLEQAAAISDLPGLAAIPLVASRELARLAKRGRAGTRQVRSADGAAAAAGIAARAHALLHRGAQLDVRRGGSDDPARTPSATCRCPSRN